MAPLLSLALMSCNPNEGSADAVEPTPTQTGETTGTFPAFYGTPPQNLLIISIDTLRPDHLTRYGDSRALMPFFDGLFEQGVALDAHQSCSNWTYPGSQCAMDGYSALDLGQIPDFTRTPLPDRPTLASTLADAGYTTVLATAKSWLGTDTNACHGFQEVIEESDVMARTIYPSGRDALLDRIEGSEAPWLLHVHFVEPHTPYSAPDSYVTGLEDLTPVDVDFTDQVDIRASCEDWDTLSEAEQDNLRSHLTLRYAGELRHFDEQLAGIWAELADLGLLQDTLVVFWSDHGEQFFERGLCTHARDLNREESDAVGLLWASNIVPGAVDIPTSHTDLAPTILEILGIDAPDEMTGTPLSQLDPDRAVHSYTDGNRGIIQTLVRGDLKLMYHWGEGSQPSYDLTMQKLLYNLAEDPGEQVNLYDSEDPDVIALWALLMPEVERMDALREGISPIDPGP